MKTKKVVAVLVLASAALASGCVAHSHAYDDGEAAYVDNGVELVAVDDDTWVVRDYDRAVYYVDDSYWLYRDNSWYRSDYYDRGFAGVTINLVPPRITMRNHGSYVHYRGDAQARRRPASPVRRDRRGDDDRNRPNGARPGDRGRGSPQSRPNRDDRRDDRREKKHGDDR